MYPSAKLFATGGTRCLSIVRRWSPEDIESRNSLWDSGEPPREKKSAGTEDRWVTSRRKEEGHEPRTSTFFSGNRFPLATEPSIDVQRFFCSALRPSVPVDVEV